MKLLSYVALGLLSSCLGCATTRTLDIPYSSSLNELQSLRHFSSHSFQVTEKSIGRYEIVIPQSEISYHLTAISLRPKLKNQTSVHVYCSYRFWEPLYLLAPWELFRNDESTALSLIESLEKSASDQKNDFYETARKAKVFPVTMPLPKKVDQATTAD